ncbi:hypothetical protein EFV37_13125 [Mesorhizobium loti]|uniref:Uncharacterized protein n=1 Tax=Mesorhizobium jarvisii TaxID=1777867 RepID=A0A6M7TE42_9HYPH|nr:MULTISPECIES: hypothetical protein [Mesorhizobium]OBQ58028.1 hypothetical protein A9K72_27870 [Mesorhizobium loti]QKC63140.1 hypothetical protein EB229_13115 [Mesorhizobium jarvisii]QKD09051.1 hypothetical protein EFV37_13125 [Mesorhizobium loti]RJT30147.1 hypothetical protein D3242_25850 [Mesorhizobium jarvisii]
MPIRTAPFPCDVHQIAEQCGIKILKPALHGAMAGRPRVCFCPKTLKRLGQAHGADHLRLVLRLIVESDGNAGELQFDTIEAVSRVVLSNLVEIRADLFDTVDLGQVRAWAQFVKPGCSTAEAMATALLWRFASPDIVMPKQSAEEVAAEAKRAEIARKGRENAKRRRLKAAGDDRAAVAL